MSLYFVLLPAATVKQQLIPREIKISVSLALLLLSCCWKRTFSHIIHVYPKCTLADLMLTQQIISIKKKHEYILSCIPACRFLSFSLCIQHNFINLAIKKFWLIVWKAQMLVVTLTMICFSAPASHDSVAIPRLNVAQLLLIAFFTSLTLKYRGVTVFYCRL